MCRQEIQGTIKYLRRCATASTENPNIKSLVSGRNEPDIKNDSLHRISPKPVVRDGWSGCLRTLEGHSNIVNLVAFCPTAGSWRRLQTTRSSSSKTRLPKRRIRRSILAKLCSNLILMLLAPVFFLTEISSFIFQHIKLANSGHDLLDFQN